MALPTSTCQDLFDNGIANLANVNKKLQVVVDKMNKITAKLAKLSSGYDLDALLSNFAIPPVHLLTPTEYLDLILNCPIAVCLLPSAQAIIDWVQTYVLNNGPFDPYNPPAAVLAQVTSYVNLANSKAKDAQALASQMVSVALAKSPLGSIARMKEAFDAIIRVSGVQVLIKATDDSLSCLLGKYPDGQSDPNVVLYNSLKSLLNFDPAGNVQVMTSSQQATMNSCTDMRKNLSSLSNR